MKFNFKIDPDPFEYSNTQTFDAETLRRMKELWEAGLTDQPDIGRAEKIHFSGLLKERTIYHQDGTKTVFRNYAIVTVDGEVSKCPVLDKEGRLVEIN